MNKRWTIALGVTSLYGAVAACGAFGTESPAGGTTSSSSSSSGGGEGGGVAPTGCAPENLARDPNHCGRCDHSCLGGACIEGRCAPVAIATVSSAGYMRATANDLFVVSADGVVRIPKGGGAATAVIKGVAKPFGIAVDATAVYCASTSDGIFRAPLDGAASTGARIVLAPAAEVALFGGRVYACDHGEAASKLALFRYLSDGGAGEKVAKDVVRCESIGFDDAAVLFGGPALFAATIGVKDQDPRSVAAQETRRLLVEDGAVYATAYGAPSVAKVPLDRPDAGALLAAGKERIGAGDLAVDDAYVYWTTGERPEPSVGRGHVAGRVYRAPKNGGGSAEELASGVVPGGVAVDEVALYWSNHENGQVFRLAK